MGPAAGLPDGGAELRGGAFTARQENGPRPADAEAEVIPSLRRYLRSRGERLARVGANALDHGAQAVGALRRQVLAKSEFVEYGKRIRCQDLLRRVAGIKREQDRDQTAHDMGVAIAQIFQP